MFKYLRALGYWISGFFSKKSDYLQKNEHVIAATFDTSIEKNNESIKTATEAVSKLIVIEEQIKTDILKKEGEIQRLTAIKSGTQVAMQRRIDQLKGSHTKEQISEDAEFIKHKGAFNDVSSSLKLLQSEIEEKEKTLKEKQSRLAKYKIDLERMRKTTKELREEKQDTIADVAIATQAKSIEDALQGISESTVDSDLAAVRAARKNAVAAARVSSELSGNNISSAENEYLKYSQAAESNTELDGLLNWGEEKTSIELKPAKLPE